MKNKIKNILNKLGVYDVARKFIIKFYYPYKNRKITKNVKGVLLRIKPIFDKNTLDWWLDYGTLLGCIREGKIIQNDIDLDFGLIEKNGSVQDAMEKAGFRLLNRTTVNGVITVEQYDIKGIGFDVFYYRKEYDKLVTNIWLINDASMPQQVAYKKGFGTLSETTFTYTDTKAAEFYGVNCKIPTNYELYLKEHFGDDYMTPNPNWSHEDEMNRVEVQKEFKVDFYV